MLLSSSRNGIEILPFRKEFAEAVRQTASESWKHTYTGIYSETRISEYIDEFYKIDELISIEEQVRDGLTSFNLALSENKIIGFCQFIKSEAFILARIYMLPNCMRKGVGTLLLSEGENWVREKGGSNYFVFVQMNNDIGIGFYERRGFERRPEFDRNDEICFEKYL